MNRIVGLFMVLVTPAVMSGCSEAVSADRDSGGVIAVTATTGMIGDIARQVGGERVSVSTLMGPGVDPHLYKPTQGDLAKLSGADVIFYNGLHLEGKMGDILEKIAGRTTTVAVSDNIPRSSLRQPAEFKGQYDPHVWFDVQLWMLATEGVREALINVAPEHRTDFEANAARYLAELEVLDSYARERLQSIPAEQRLLVTAHDAFGYFGRAYDIEVMGLQGISTGSEYGLQDLGRLIEIIVERKVKAVFVESSVSPKSIEALRQGVDAKGHSVRIGGTLFSDAMGPEGSPEGTYIGMVRHNVDTIVEALS